MSTEQWLFAEYDSSDTFFVYEKAGERFVVADEIVSRARAKLIAAAPEMLAALKHLASHIDRERQTIDWCNTTVAEIDAAIAKAE